MIDAIDLELHKLRTENARLKAALELIYATAWRSKKGVEQSVRAAAICRHMDCDRPARAKGYCDTHYRRVRKLEAA